MEQNLDINTLQLPPVDTAPFRSNNEKLFEQLATTLVIVDDDPTGNQTVYDIPLLATWDKETFLQEFKAQTPAFFVLTNSRSLTAKASAEVFQELARNLLAAAKKTNRKYILLSRSDSTLRGHFPAEIENLKTYANDVEAVTIFCPVMFEGNRVTVNDTHYIQEENTLLPVASTAFAEDKSFGYQNSNLKEYIKEKSSGSISQDKIHSLPLDKLRKYSTERLVSFFENLPAQAYCILNALCYEDLDKACHALLLATQNGKPFAYRTSSSMVPSLIGLPPKELLDAGQMLQPTDQGGLLVLGSYVPKSSAQFNYLYDRMNQENALELDVKKAVKKGAADYLDSLSRKLNQKLDAGEDVLLYTSRELLTAADVDGNLEIGSVISKALVTLVEKLEKAPRYLIAKGGITSNDLAVKGLQMNRSTVLGQILRGVPVWEMGKDTRFPGLPYVVFPGNVGSESALWELTKKLNKQ
ncbi:MAG: four-carbon acid sugar kinase family protein [Leeuwenhoekiella sp.]